MVYKGHISESEAQGHITVVGQSRFSHQELLESNMVKDAQHLGEGAFIMTIPENT